MAVRFVPPFSFLCSQVSIRAARYMLTIDFGPGTLAENLAAGTGNYNIASAIKGWTDEACKSSHRPVYHPTLLAHIPT